MSAPTLVRSPPGTTLAKVIARFGPELMAQYGDRLLPSHLHALTAMQASRSSLAKQMLAQCGDCSTQRLVPNSCGHRSYPHCQHFESQRWIERQTQALLPGAYFLITFTLPQELRGLAWVHQKLVYSLLMQCAWETLAEFAATLQSTCSNIARSSFSGAMLGRPLLNSGSHIPANKGPSFTSAMFAMV